MEQIWKELQKVVKESIELKERMGVYEHSVMDRAVELQAMSM